MLPACQPERPGRCCAAATPTASAIRSAPSGTATSPPASPSSRSSITSPPWRRKTTRALAPAIARRGRGVFSSRSRAAFGSAMTTTSPAPIVEPGAIAPRVPGFLSSAPFNAAIRSRTSRVAPRPRTAAIGARAIRLSGTESAATSVLPTVVPRVAATRWRTAGIAASVPAATRASVGGSTTRSAFAGACLTVVRCAARSGSSRPVPRTATTFGRCTKVLTAALVPGVTRSIAGFAAVCTARPSVSEPSRGGAARSPRSDATAVRLAPPRAAHSAATARTAPSSLAAGTRSRSSPVLPRNAGRVAFSLTNGSGWRRPVSTRFL